MKLTLCERCWEEVDAHGGARVVFDATPDGIVVSINGKAQPPHPHPNTAKAGQE
jgi:hypothetical protein